MQIRRMVIGAAIAGCAILLNGSSAVAGECSHDSTHWYGAGWSGYGANGTELDTTLPGSNAVSGSTSTSDEAVWLINYYNISNALECGWFIGYWPYGSNGFFNQFNLYMTWNNGTSGDRLGIALAANSLLKMRATNRDNCVFISGGSTWTDSVSYSVSNGWNYGQGEVTQNNHTCMGGCGGETFNGFWTSDYSTWTAWGFISTCANSPYWVTTSASYIYTNGGGG